MPGFQQLHVISGPQLCILQNLHTPDTSTQLQTLPLWQPAPFGVAIVPLHESGLGESA